jgi:hypothetical protein
MDNGATEPRLDATGGQIKEKHEEMEEQLRKDRIKRYLEFMKTRVIDLENEQKNESAKLLKSRIDSDEDHIQDATFENNEWRVVFTDESMQKIEHTMRVELDEKEWNKTNEKLSEKWPKTMQYIIELHEYYPRRSCMYCDHGAPNYNSSRMWKRFNTIIQEEVGLTPDQLTKELDELPGGRCSTFSPDGVKEVLKKRIDNVDFSI